MPPMIRNFLESEKQPQPSSHGGEGPVDLYEIWGAADFKSPVDFIDRMVVPPGTKVGTHRHGNNEEIYILLAGRGRMTIEGEAVTVKKGDMILNPAGGAHGLVNDSDTDIDLLVIQVGLRS